MSVEPSGKFSSAAETPGNMKGRNVADDVRVYTVPLTEAEVKALAEKYRVNGHGRRRPRAASVAVFLNALFASCAQAGTTSDANAAVFAMQARPSGVE